jgi:pimeloyl-ACP methyl ester carboxylesterase
MAQTVVTGVVDFAGFEEWSEDIDGLKLAGLRTPGNWGGTAGENADARPLIVTLHGWLDNAASFVPLARQLPQFRWLCIDLSGHGNSAHKVVGVREYHAVDWALEVALLLGRFDVRDACLLGHSLGAALSVLVAATSPQRIARLALLDGLAPLYTSADAFIDRMRSFLSEATNPPRNRTFETFDVLVAQRSRNGEMTEVSARLLMQRGHLVVEGGVQARADANLKRTSPMRLMRPQIESVLRRIECPVLVVDFGNAHFGRPPSDHSELLACVGDIRVETIPGGHHLHMDDPARVAPVLAEFLRT